MTQIGAGERMVDLWELYDCPTLCERVSHPNESKRWTQTESGWRTRGSVQPEYSGNTSSSSTGKTGQHVSLRLVATGRRPSILDSIDFNLRGRSRWHRRSRNGYRRQALRRKESRRSARDAPVEEDLDDTPVDDSRHCPRAVRAREDGGRETVGEERVAEPSSVAAVEEEGIVAGEEVSARKRLV